MTFYHGTSAANLKPSRHVGKRYPFPYLFGSATEEHARLYARFHARVGAGHVHPFRLRAQPHTHDLRFVDTYTASFRNLVHELYRRGHAAVLFTNCYDGPSANLRLPMPVDIIAVFDLDWVLQ